MTSCFFNPKYRSHHGDWPRSALCSTQVFLVVHDVGKSDGFRKAGSWRRSVASTRDTRASFFLF